MRIGREQSNRSVQQGSQTTPAHGHSRQQSLQARRGIGSIVGPLTRWQSGVLAGRLTDQRAQVVSEHLGKHIDQQRVLAQARGTFQLGAVFESFESLFNSPALMVELAKHRHGKILGGQTRRHHARLPIGGDQANEPDPRGRVLSQ